AAFLAMEKFKVDKVMVGADTICANGDVINKVGTSQIALAAKELGIDFLVAVESIKFSPQSVMGKIVEIEERSRSEVLGRKMPEVSVYNPAFDITPAEYVTMLITELGVMPPQAAYLILKEKFGWELNFLRNEKFL
ncbi:MAG TPA: ribose 1,5-bisphosphate isomerase, partial [Candidatus Altiarchaeales archaeon]|nr:ribose 1,5-bisphosphate isomerase [Candidatus Altiarchaeales archaeon]